MAVLLSTTKPQGASRHPPSARRGLAGVLGAMALGVGCATSSPLAVGSEPTVLWEQAAETPRPKEELLSTAEAKRIARSHDAAHSCEVTARAMRQRNPKRGWQVMEQCIWRKDFTDLEILVDGGWADEVRASPDAPQMLAHVIAVRGGDVTNDLRVVRRRRLPLYSLAAALAEPEAYQGRFVLMRGNALRGRLSGGQRAFRLVETKVMALSEWVDAPRSSRRTFEVDSERRQQQDISIHGRSNDLSRTTEGEKVEVFRNISVATGLELVGRIQGPAPSLEPATDYVILLRFDGASTTADRDDEDDVGEGLASVVEYYEPQNGLFARLGR